MTDLHPNLDKIIFSTFEIPKVYSFIPQSYQLNWEDPNKFIPDRLFKYFNQKIYYNFLHRECFNSVVLPGNTLSEIEKQQYANCQNKHSGSLGIFRDIIVAKRKWQGFKHYINVKEYSRSPEEMTSSIPTDPLLKGAYLHYVEVLKNDKVKQGLPDLLGLHTPHKSDIVHAYLSGTYLPDSKLAKSKEERNDKYTEYKELSAKYDSQIRELLKKRVNIKNWKDIIGEDFNPSEDGEEAGTESNEEAGSEESGNVEATNADSDNSEE
jgi:hypothetical protein